MVSEISRIGRRVVDILTTVDTFHKRGIAVYVQQFNMLSFEGGKENPMVMMLLQMLSIGAELENNLRKNRQREGIALAKLQQKYVGRREGSKANKWLNPANPWMTPMESAVNTFCFVVTGWTCSWP